MPLESQHYEKISLESDISSKEVQGSLEKALQVSEKVTLLGAKMKPEEQNTLQNQIHNLALKSIQNKHDGEISDLNINSFDTDGENGLDAFEFKAYIQAIDTAIEAIILTGGVEKYTDIREDAADDASSWWQRNIQ